MSELTKPRAPTIAAQNRAAVAGWIIWPILTVVILFIGGGSIRGCLGPVGVVVDCPTVGEPGPIPFIGTPAGALWTSVALVLAWLASGAWLLRALWRAGHPAVLEVVRTTFVAGIVFGLAGFVEGLLFGRRLFNAAEMAFLLGSVGVLLAWEFRLLWLVTRRGASGSLGPSSNR